MSCVCPTALYLFICSHASQLFAAPESGLSLVDASAGVADLLSCKDATEVLNVKKAAMLASKASRVLRGHVEGGIREKGEGERQY